MKRLLITIIGALALGATLPAFVGPDFQAIEQARKAKQVAQIERRADLQMAQRPVGVSSPSRPPAPLVLPLDHGPRAQTRSSENQSRKNRYAARLKACNEATK